jgi:hypothetical protein
MLVSNNLPAADARAWIRFAPRGDSLLLSDTARTYTIDSVKISLTIQQRDSLQPGIALLLYKLPPTVDTTITFPQLTALLNSSNFIDTLVIPDTLKSGQIEALFTGDLLSRVALTPADSGVLRIGIALTAPAPTGVRIGTVRSDAGSPLFLTYVKAAIADTTLINQTLTRVPFYNSYLTAAPFPLPTVQTLVVGGAPSSRALIRFNFPPVLKDTAELIRATLELVPVTPILGVSNVQSSFIVQGILSDLGAKSPPVPAVTTILAFNVPTADVISLEVLPLTVLWQGTAATPPALFVSIAPEASSFSAPVFGSSSGNPLFEPRLRISYTRPYQFARP